MPPAPKQAHVYFRRDGKRVLVVTVHTGRDGGIGEAEGPLSLTTWDDDALGESITTALEQSALAAREFRGSRPPGAATLKISGEPSPRSFDAAFILIRITEAPGEYLLQGKPDPTLALSATLSMTALPAEFARQATRLFQICRDRKF
jgi:hypothetical protein